MVTVNIQVKDGKTYEHVVVNGHDLDDAIRIAQRDGSMVGMIREHIVHEEPQVFDKFTNSYHPSVEVKNEELVIEYDNIVRIYQ